MHLKRWLTAIVGLPILIFLIGFGPRWLFYSFLFLVSLGALLEFYRIVFRQIPKLLGLLSCLSTLALFLSLYFRQISLAPFFVFLWALVALMYYTFTYHLPLARRTEQMGTAVFGLVYTGLPPAMLMMIDFYPGGKGRLWIFFLLLVVFASDTGAFYFGRLFGKHKLYEAVSSKKTWEGAIGGLLLSLVAANLFLAFFALQPVTAETVVLIIILAVVGQLGDLAESMLKRVHDAKDSGCILPGHGGILDRIDGLLFAIPVLYGYLYSFMQ